ncbi:MAG: CheY-like chemotaxis protein [Planctomycetota bacterium]|jgi:CheY-like chemotaxis protein
METLGFLAAGFAHDFNGLLAVLVSSCEVVSGMLQEQGVGRPAAAIRLLAAMQQRALNGASMTQRILDFSRREPPKEHVDLVNGLTAVAEVLPAILGSDIELSLASTVTEAFIEADAGALERIVVNLATNARDAMPMGGKLELRVSIVVLDETTAVGGLTPGQHVLLEVVDDGCGMGERTRSRSLEPFFTTKPEGEGTGLGLATVSHLVRGFGGCIEVASGAESGTTLRLYFPKVEPARLQIAPSTTATATKQRDQGTILLVEDEVLLRSAVKLQLTHRGYQVFAVGTSRKALELLASKQLTIDLLLSDVVLPDINGWELAMRVLACRPETRVLFMSGYSEEALSEQEGIQSGIRILQKPFEQQELVATVRETLAGNARSAK